MTQRRGYWREPDGDPVTAAEAVAIWADHAYPVLACRARTYHAVITYGELGRTVQELSGVRTSLLLQNWIGAVLAEVVHETHRRGDPPLTALVVRADDGRVGSGYDLVLEVAGESPIQEDLKREQHAAQARLRCYRRFGAVLPADGGEPELPPRLRPARSGISGGGLSGTR